MANLRSDSQCRTSRVFNLFPLPPLDGRTYPCGDPTKSHRRGCCQARAVRGLAILIGLLIILPMLGAQLGVDLSFLSHLIAIAANAVIGAIVQVTGKG